MARTRPLVLLLIAAALTIPTTSHGEAATPARTGLPAGGPALLHAPLVSAPQLENTGRWRARPLLISGASAYRSGEFVYQDFLYDDLGDGSSPYPDGAAYAGNAADLVEVRLRPAAGATAVRITYNTLRRPELTGTTLALGGSATSAPRIWPHGARVTSPADVFVTVHGSAAEVVDATSGRRLAVKVPVRVDTARYQVELLVPHRVFNPTGQKAVRLAAATGVWDPRAGSYLAPDDGAALYNVAFRYDETTHPRGVVVATWFRDTGQRAALTAGNLARYAAVVDFTKLARGIDDDLAGKPGGIPVTGSMSRINVTRFSTAPGRGTTSDQTTSCDPPACTPEFSGRLQQYFVHVPATRRPGGYGLAIYNHGCGNNQNEMFGSRYARELAALDGGTIVMSANGRGKCLWYQGISAASIFETWADVAARYPLDPRSVRLTGYSMGGYGTYMLATSYPGLWARALALHPCAQRAILNGAPETDITPLLASLRHVPLAMWNSVDDPLCHYPSTRLAVQELDGRGYAYNAFTLGNDHFTDISNDVLSPAITWLGDGEVASDPATVTYVVQPALAFPKYGLEPARHVYWLRDLRTRVKTEIGTIDARSLGIGLEHAAAMSMRPSAGVLTGGDHAPLPYTAETRDPGPVRSAPRQDRLELTVRNIGAVTVDVAAARVTCRVQLVVDTDGPVTVTLKGCGRTATFPATR